jgi:hypothetical protein
MPTKKAQATPTAAAVGLAKQLTAESSMKVLWGCDASEHLYEARVSDRALRNRGCPACADGTPDLIAGGTTRSFGVMRTAKPSLFVFIPEPSFLNGDDDQIGPYSPDEARVLAGRLLTEADEVERWVNKNPEFTNSNPKTTTCTVRSFDVTSCLGPTPPVHGVPATMLFVDIADASCLNGDENQIGPYSPDEARVLAGRLFTEAAYVERCANERAC